ncbi:hypothetical protein PIB30_067767 [Stylosanthes scabra]|uniref:Uncharacterized protein n=1 Tax=Stylosanthes scabra TaxID=79078 RepID=A0ABU6XMR2_9FABA|nr:hypothetical protein [Stylosanthes scabra]
MNVLNCKKTTLLRHLTISMRTSNRHPITDSIIHSLKGGMTTNKTGGINIVHNEVAQAEEEEDEEEEGEDDWLYELLAKLASSDESDDEEEVEEEEEEEIVEKQDEEETFFIATIFSGSKKVEHEIPIKCEDPGPCLVTCKIRGVDIRECLCDPRTCGSVMPFELYETLDLGPLKKSKEVFTMVNASIVSVAGIAENVLVKKKKKKEDLKLAKKKKKHEEVKSRKKKKRKEDEDEERIALKCSSLGNLLGKLKKIGKALRNNQKMMPIPT